MRYVRIYRATRSVFVCGIFVGEFSGGEEGVWLPRAKGKFYMSIRTQCRLCWQRRDFPVLLEQILISFGGNGVWSFLQLMLDSGI